MLKIQTWQPDTHPGHVLEIEWEYNQATGRDTGRPHRGVSVLYPDGTHVRDDAADAHYQKLLAEHMIKNQALAVIIEHLPPTMRKNLLHSDGDPVLNDRHGFICRRRHNHHSGGGIRRR